MHRIDIAYPSVDAKGNTIRLSGSIVIPGNVYDGSSPVDGVVLYNRYTQMQAECCPTSGFAQGEFVFMCIKMTPQMWQKVWQIIAAAITAAITALTTTSCAGYGPF